MKKRIISLILAISFLFSLIPAVRAEEKADEPRSIEAQIRAFADSIDQEGAESTAAMTLAMHGITGGGKKLTMDSTSALAAVLMNSETVQAGLAKMFADTMDTMQRLDWNSAPKMRVHFNWYGTYSNYKLYILTDAEKAPEDKDWLQTDENYDEKGNDYDSALEWMVGHCNGAVEIKSVRDDGAERTYRVTMKLKDRFDFSTAGRSGFKKFLSGVGMLLFQEYDWECTVSFELTVPCSYDHCTHHYGAYHWTYDGENKTMHTDDSENWIQNNAQHRTFTKSDGSTTRYYALDNPIRLDHNSPWVMEYDILKPSIVMFSPVEQTLTKTQLTIWHTSNSNIYAAYNEYVLWKIVDGMDTYATDTHYYGTKPRELFDCRTDQLYTFRLENIIAADGSNMIYLTVIDPKTDTVCVERVPMDDYYYDPAGESGTELISRESAWLSGKDFHINFFGNQAVSFGTGYLDLRIWENGKDGGIGDYFITKTTEPSCAAPGGTTRTCSKCGYSEQLDLLPALGHDYGEWETVKEPGCAEEGRMERICKTCGDTERKPIPALGHNWTDWAADGEWDCTEGGIQERHCLQCGDSETRNVDSAAHLYEARIVDPTCVDLGYTIYTCTVCGYSYKTNFTNTGDHSFGAWNTLRDATEQEEGLLERSCTICGVTEQKRIPKLQNPFSDVGTADYFYAPVLWAVSRGITTGTSATTFDPDSSCLRSQVVTFLWRAAGEPEPQSAENPFVDVKKSDYYYKAVLWAVEKGITNGIDGTHFGPETACSRSQVVTFLYRAFGKPTVANTDNPFVDVPGSEWYTAPVLWAVEKGITNGIDETHFGPDNECSRSQIVTFLYRAYS